MYLKFIHASTFLKGQNINVVELVSCVMSYALC